jgi:hypothetical protein
MPELGLHEADELKGLIQQTESKWPDLFRPFCVFAECRQLWMFAICGTSDRERDGLLKPLRMLHQGRQPIQERERNDEEEQN